MSLSRTIDGLLYRSDNSLTGWSGDAEWTSAADPQFVCYPFTRQLLSPTTASADADGVREGQLFIEGSDWWLLYDGGDGSTGWRQFLAHSTDRGLTWSKLGAVSMGLNKIVSGAWAATATGWLEKRGSTYYLHRVVAVNAGSSPDTGLPSNPYYWDCWQNSTLGVSGWTAAPNVPTGNQRYDLSGVGSSEHLPGGMILSAGVYYNFAETSTGSALYTLSISTGSNPDGPFTAAGAVIADDTTTGFGGRRPENGRPFFSSTLNRYCCLANLIAVAATFTDANAIGYSTSLTDWSAAIWRRTQFIGPLDTLASVMGVQSPVTGPSGALIEGPNGEVPIVYDADPAASSPGWHRGRRLRGAVLEPAIACLRLAQSANTTVYAIRRSQALTDFVLELAVCVTAANGAGMGFSIEYRGDATGANCYRCTMDTLAGLKLEKVVSGSASTLASSSGTLTFAEAHQVYRFTISIVGNLHTFTFEGETHVAYTDSASPITTGTHLGLRAHGMAGDVRNLSVRTSDTLTVQGLAPSATGYLRSYGALPVATFTANGSGVATVTASHWPHDAIEAAGVDYSVTERALWGGDTVLLSATQGRFSNVFAGALR